MKTFKVHLKEGPPVTLEGDSMVVGQQGELAVVVGGAINMRPAIVFNRDTWAWCEELLLKPA